MTERQLRQGVVNVIRSWLGWSEANGKFRKIIDLYNTQTPLPRGYKLQYDDEWCAATVTAAGIQAGLEDIIFGECSCPKMVALYQRAGRWMEDDGYMPQIGDIVMYRWDDGADYAATDNTSSPNHVGMVAEVNGNIMTIIEGNKGQKVAARSMFVNGRYIRGYCLPDYQSKAEGTNLTAEDVRTIVREEWAAQEAKRNNAEASGWAVEYIQRALQAGILAGVDDGQGGKTIARPQGISTREEMATMGVAILEAIRDILNK